MPVAVAGMHRSGTSMVTRMLSMCGLELGAEERLMPGSQANPHGYFEHLDIVGLNDSILNAFAGGWDLPPRLPHGWVLSPGLEPARETGARLLASIRTDDDQWGWKDPRTSVLLPFWKHLAPDLRTVVCLRNPLSVALSLQRRNDSSLQFGMQLWLAYTQLLLENTTPEERFVTVYESYRGDASEELRRLCAWVGLQPAESQLAAAVATVDGALDHNSVDLATMVRVGATANVIATYLELLAEAQGAAAMLEEQHAVVAELVPQLGQLGVSVSPAVHSLAA